jgi:hypothetical protein
VNVQERIAKLEALLSRVSARAAEPRRSVAVTAEPPVEARPLVTNGPAASVLVAEPRVAQPRPVPQPPEPVEDETEELELDAAELTSVPPPPVRPEASVVATEDPTESRERMVAAPAVDEVTDAVHLSRSSSSDDDAPELEVSGTADLENEAADEEPPASSRRPIPSEPPLEELAFGDAPAPPMPHTPPPESGRQVAVTPPELDFDGEATGVRNRPEEAIAKAESVRPKAESVRPAAEAPRAEVATAPAKSVPPAAPMPVAKLTAQVVRPSLDAPDGGVAVFVGQPAEFKPSSFGDLLDASFDL